MPLASWGREYLSTLESLLEAWPLRRMAEEHSIALSTSSNYQKQSGNQVAANVSGGGGSVSHVEATASTWSTDDPARTAAAAAAVVTAGGGGAGGEAWVPAAPHQTARKTAAPNGSGGGGGGGSAAGSPMGGAPMLAKLRISPPANDAGQAAEVLHRHAIEAMAIAEQVRQRVSH